MNSAPLNLTTALRDHGIAVYNGHCRSFKAWRDAETGRDYVYCGILSTTSVVVQVDVATGKSKYFNMAPPSGGPFGMEITLEGHVLATSTGGQLCRIDPKTGKSWIVADTKGHWIWRIERGADGKYYIGTSPQCRLFRYDANTDKLEDLGQMSKTQTYVRRVACGRDGYVYCSTGCTASQIVAYHIATGKMKELLPKKDVTPNWLDLFGHGRDGRIYVHTNCGNSYRFEHGAIFPAPNAPQELSGYWQWLPDGTPVTRVDPDAIRVGKKVIPYTYQTGGANVFHLAEGPHQTVYSSTIMPLFLSRYTPATEKLESLGRGGPDNGEAYSIGHCDGKLYYATYSQGFLMEYDPAKPWHKDPPGSQKWKTNPKLLGYLGIGNHRPRAMSIDHIQKSVWVGGFAEYGFPHGGLACYDIRKKKLTAFDKIIPDQSIDALAVDATGDILYGGTNIGRGAGGMSPITRCARLFAWDTRKKKVLWKIEPFPEAKATENLLYRDGKLYGTMGMKFFCFDPVARKMDYVVDSQISAGRPQSMCFGPDGNIYGITWMVLYRWRPETGKIEELYRCLGDAAKPFAGGALFHRGAVIINDRYYFSCGPKVMSLPVPLAMPE